MKAEDLIREYRPTMPEEVLHAWAKDVVKVLGTLQQDLARERQMHSGTIDQRDTAHEAADRLAYALFGIDEIGEHSSSNCPWENAAERLEEMAALSATEESA